MIEWDDYVELHCHSHFSLLDGASAPEELVERAVEVGMAGLALTDHNAVYGAVRFAQAAQEAGVHPILGAELTLEDGAHLTLLVEDEQGWQNLCRLITQAQADTPKGEACLSLAALEGHTGGLIALSGCHQGAVAAPLRQRNWSDALAAASRLRDLFGPEHFWIELQHHLRPGDTTLVAASIALAKRLELGYVATNNVHYARQAGHRLQDVLVCIRHHARLDASDHLRRPNSEFYLKSPEEMAYLFAEIPQALANTLRIAERCRFVPPVELQALPPFPVPKGMAAAAYLRSLCEQALPRHYGAAPARVRKQLDHELQVIERSGLVNYFLVVYDVVRFAREHNILCQGRGSACNSLVAYLLDISPIDPLAHNLVFERFLSEERPVAPDIDIDFDAERREEVIQYIYSRYGREHAAMACTFVTYQARGALRDVSKVLGIPQPLLDQAVRTLDGYGASAFARSAILQERAAQSPLWRQLITLCEEIIGLPRHLGLHNGGMVLAAAPLATRVPIEPAAMLGRSVVQWDKDSLEESGLIKLDILGLRMLTAIAEAATIVEATTGERPALDRLAFDDPAVYAMIARADTIGCFQVESRAQAQVLPRLQPAHFDDLVVAISLVRPGPIQGSMVRPYWRRRRGEEPVTYLHPLLQPALEETLGVVLFQEQVLKIARDVAGFTPGGGELLRRALGKKDAVAQIERFRADFLQGAQARGVPPAVAEAIFEQLRAFGSYSFPRSHAAAFAVIVYWSAWLKHYYPAAFFCAILNNQPMGFWSPAVLIGDARRHGVRVLAVDVNHSVARCQVVDGALRIGLSYVKGLGEAGGERVVRARAAAPFKSLSDFCRRTRLPKRLVEHLIRAGAMDGWARPRRDLLWELGGLHYQEEELELEFPDDGVSFPPLSDLEVLAWEHEMLGLSTRDHLLALYRPWLRTRGILGSRELERCANGRFVRVAGLPVIHQAPPTARGIRFITLEDEDGMINVVVKPDIYDRFRMALRLAPLLLIEGTVERHDGVTNLVAQRATALAERPSALAV